MYKCHCSMEGLEGRQWAWCVVGVIQCPCNHTRGGGGAGLVGGHGVGCRCAVRKVVVKGRGGGGNPSSNGENAGIQTQRLPMFGAIWGWQGRYSQCCHQMEEWNTVPPEWPPLGMRGLRVTPWHFGRQNENAHRRVVSVIQMPARTAHHPPGSLTNACHIIAHCHFQGHRLVTAESLFRHIP